MDERNSLLSGKLSQFQLRWLALVAVGLAYLFLLSSTLLRMAESGAGCPDWFLCAGTASPSATTQIVLALAQQVLLWLLSIEALFLLIGSWRGAVRLRWLASIAGGISVTQIALIYSGALASLSLMGGIVQVGGGLLLLSAFLLYALETGRTAPARDFVAGDRFPAFALAAAVSVFALILTGVAVAAGTAGPACPDWPLCNGVWVPVRQGELQTLHGFHRLTVVGVGVLLTLNLWFAWRQRRANVRVLLVSILAVTLFLTQIGLGGWMALRDVPPLAALAHAGIAIALWAVVVALTALVWRRVAVHAPQVADTAIMSAGQPRIASTVATYFMLTKPYIIVLLLLTSLTAMFLASDGWPPAYLVFFTMLGGFLSAGGANALNSYIERDVDGIMTRTRRRPMPSGRVNPTSALLFAVALNVAAFVVFAVFVNLLAAVIATVAMLYYVFIYTCWLKRSTHHNIVIGGAAGALPPLVGWAAVTGRIDLLALYLFAIIFYWTPPHTWALTLLVQNDYARARIPMLPVVVGEEETRRQIVLYTVLMIAITLVPAGLRLLGVAYLISALVLGGLFLLYAVQLQRQPSKAGARRLYKYSTLYLALLFLAMVMDKQLFA